MQPVNPQIKNEQINALNQEIAKQQEVVPEVIGELEQTKAAETITHQNLVSTTSTDDPANQTTQTTQPQAVVDDTDQLTTLHEIVDTNVQKLTTIADKEEEDFIKGVEAAHGHK